MKKFLKYKKTETNDRVLINVNQIGCNSYRALCRAFGVPYKEYIREWCEDFVDEDTGKVHAIYRLEWINMPDDIIIKFDVYKKRPSNIKWLGYIINFTYDISKLIVEDQESQYKLHFQVNQQITRGIDTYNIDVKYDCTTKKNIIKALLEQLINKYY